jgi:YggT family protein
MVNIYVREGGLRRLPWPLTSVRVNKELPMVALYQTLDLILSVVFWIMMIYILMSWLINFQVLNIRQPFVNQLWSGLNRLLEPIFTPIRRVLPDTRPLDLSPLVVFVIIIALRQYILPALLLGR